jgi:hypothetical protein
LRALSNFNNATRQQFPARFGRYGRISHQLPGRINRNQFIAHFKALPKKVFNESPEI